MDSDAVALWQDYHPLVEDNAQPEAFIAAYNCT